MHVYRPQSMNSHRHTKRKQLQIIYGTLISSYDSEASKCQNFMEFQYIPMVYDVCTMNSHAHLLAAFLSQAHSIQGLGWGRVGEVETVGGSEIILASM
jgi:hypothetical protein